MTGEWWVGIYGWPEYAVSSEGRVKRTAGGRGCRANYILKQRLNKDGYRCVTLQHAGERKGFLVSRLVCSAFYGPMPLPNCHAAHKDGDRANNRANNLRWATPSENDADKDIHGTRMRGETHSNAKLTEQAVRAIRADPRTLAAIAAEYGVCESNISQIKRGKIWSDPQEQAA
jgi:hypothetical protein